MFRVSVIKVIYSPQTFVVSCFCADVDDDSFQTWLGCYTAPSAPCVSMAVYSSKVTQQEPSAPTASIAAAPLTVLTAGHHIIIDLD